ncbi:MAG: hypothetical protein H6565_04440 [Lewinellaceae bacterium]|nr:hypothetical protein [Lewinellaceae bacterium]
MKKHVMHFSGWLVVLWHCLLLAGPSVEAQSIRDTESVAKAEEEGGEGKGCCAFSLQFINLYETKYIKKVRVSAICDTRICCADGDEWAQSDHFPDYVEWFPADSSAVPFGNAIDNEFLIYLDSETSPFYLQVDWYDANDQVVCRHTVEIACDGSYKEDEDWTQYTSTTSLNDERLFVFAVREEDEDEDGCEDFLKNGICLFDYSIECYGIDEYLVSLNANPGYELYQWAIVSGPSSASINPDQNTSVILSVPGTYVVSLQADDLDLNETCSTDEIIVIPGFTPGFTTQVVPVPCSATYRFTPYGASDPSVVTGVTWSCAQISTFPSYCSYGGYVEHNFTAPGTYTITMTIMDIYGCMHSIVQDVVVSFACNAGAEVDRYFLCTGCEGQSNVQVYFNNISTGGTCPLTFIWDFGDGDTLVTNENMLSVSHTYAVPNCAIANNYTVTLTMIDSGVNPCTSMTTIPLVIAPCRPDLQYRVCPDGKIKCWSTVPGVFTFTPSLDVVWGESDIPDADGLRTFITVRSCSVGVYNLSFEGHCNTGGRCVVNQSISVDSLLCCAKNDAERAHHEFSVSGTDYRMKYKMVQRNLLLYHKIRLKTKLKKRKSLFGISYWKGTKADQIEAHCDGTIYKSDPECNCVLPHTVDDGIVRYNKTKAKKNISIGSRFRSRTHSIMSTHRVIKNGYDVVKYLYLGNDCDESCY